MGSTQGESGQPHINGVLTVAALCAPGDRSLAKVDLGVIDRLGIAVGLSLLDPGCDGWVQRVGPGTVVVAYLSSACAEPQIHSLLVEQIDAALGRPLPVLGIELDESAAALLKTRLILRVERHCLSAQEYQRQLYGLVLECADRTGYNRVPEPGSAPASAKEEETRIYPHALIVSDGASEIVIPPDFRGLVTLGRSETCQLSLNSSFASRMHGALRSDGERYLYRDMSRNGTLLYDGHEEFLLHDEECQLPLKGELRIGEITLRLLTKTD